VECLGEVITTFRQKRQDKQVKYERRVLKEITPKRLKESFQVFLNLQHSLGVTFSKVLEEGCYDVAIESFLLGAHFSKFGFYGESENTVKERCTEQLHHLVETLYNFFLYWGKVSNHDLYSEALHYQCEQFVLNWWKEGFVKGEKRYKLRLH